MMVAPFINCTAINKEKNMVIHLIVIDRYEQMFYNRTSNYEEVAA